MSLATALTPSMTRAEVRQIGINGLWKQNSIMVQVLGMCPVIAVSTSLVNAVSLGLATALVMALASGAAAALRGVIPHEVRIPIFILIIASLVTLFDQLFNAYLHSLYLVLGIFIPLIVTNCIVLARVEAFAAKNGVLASAWDGLAMGLGLVSILAILGGMRELLGQGTLFAGINNVIAGASTLHILPDGYPHFLLAILPPGAFLTLGCIIAVRNVVVAARPAPASARAAA